MRFYAFWVAVALAALAIVPAAALGGAGSRDRKAAEHALERVNELKRGIGVRTGRELTPALVQLAVRRAALGATARKEADALLARPIDPADPDYYGDPYIGKVQTDCPAGSIFCFHWVNDSNSPDAPALTDTNGNKVPDYIDQMEGVFAYVYGCENGTAAGACAQGAGPGLGWQAPVPDGAAGGAPNNRFDVYVKDLYPQGIYGYAAPECPSDARACPAYMAMDKDFSRFATSTTTGLDEMEVTAAHEYNHVLQMSYDANEDLWLFESTAVYMEDKVYPSVNDYLQYLPDWVGNLRQPMTAFPNTNGKAYGSAVWNHWLDHRYGAGVVRGAWERSVAASDFAPNAYTGAISAAGGSGFSDEFDRFAAAVAEWQAPGAGFPDRYPDVPRDGSLPAGTQVQPFALPHTTFALYDVPIPAGAPPVIRLTGTLPAGTAGAIALVGRTGSDPAAGSVTSNLTSMPNGGTAVVSLDNPAQFGRITAMVANSDPSQNGYDQSASDWIFTKDANGVVVSMAAPGPPLAVTGAAGPISDHGASVNASIDPQLNDTTWSIEYGRTSAYGSKTAPQSLPASTVGSAGVTAALAGLDPRSTYHYRVVASNPAGVTTGADMTFDTARDVTKPAVSFKAKRQRQARVRKAGLVYAGRCSERCSGSAQLLVTRGVARRLKLPAVLGNARVKLEAQPTSTTLRVRLTRRASKAFRSIDRSFTATLHLRVADASGNAVTVNRRILLTR